MTETSLPSPEAWLAQFASQLGVEPPTAAEIEALLDLAGTAAHASARTAAPIACFLVGRAGIAIADAKIAAEAVADAISAAAPAPAPGDEGP